MGCIVCATRGGEGSRASQLEAISRAKDSDSRLVFLYVVDVSAVGEFDEQLEPALRAEFSWLGRALLNVAQQRALQAGLDARTVIRRGDVRSEISRFLREEHADLLILGAPRGTSRNVFGDDAVEQFAEALQQSSGVSVHIVRPEDLK